MIAAEGVVEKFRPLINVESNYQETCISYLPLSHIAAQMTDVWIPIRAGACVWFAKPDALKVGCYSFINILHSLTLSRE